MKRLYTIISITVLLIFSFQKIGAETVSASSAEQVARNFFKDVSGTKILSPAVRLVWDGTDGKKVEAPFYVFNSGEGFVLVSGDDRMEPILGYSTSGTFDVNNIPDGLKVLLESYRKQVNGVRQGKVRGAVDAAGKWAQVRSESAAPQSVVYLQTALWGQGSPFYNNCPLYGGNYCITGCGATALAILMRYYKYPSQAYGTIPGYTTEQLSITLPAKSIDYPYDWNNMLMSYSGSSTAAQQSAVATLMADIGQMIKSDYSPSNTWSYTSSLLPAMLKHMKYSNKAVIRDRVNYSTCDWVEMLKSELDAKHPVYYRGDSPVVGGHFYLIDGYDSEDRLHFNWGWNGSSNGYYYVSDTDFSSGENAIIGLVPDYNWTAPTTSSDITFYSNTSSYFGLWADTAWFEENVSAKVRMSIFNQGTSAYSGKIKISIRHADNTVDDIITSSDFSLNSFYYRTMSFSLKFSKISNGDELVLYYLKDGKWALVDDGELTIPLRYNLVDVLSLKYDKESSRKVLWIRGMTGMKLTDPGHPSGVTFTSPAYEYANPVSGNYTISNGKQSYTVNLKF